MGYSSEIDKGLKKFHQSSTPQKTNGCPLKNSGFQDDPASFWVLAPFLGDVLPRRAKDRWDVPRALDELRGDSTNTIGNTIPYPLNKIFV